jgi:hypothetical protein
MLDGTLAIPSFGSGPRGRDKPVEFNPHRAARPVPDCSARSIGTWFHLISIGAVAAATIGVFFGTGFLLLLQQAQGARPLEPAVGAAAFVRLPLPMAAPVNPDAPRLSLPEHAAVERGQQPARQEAR